MVPLELVLVRRDELAIGVSRLAVYPTGFTFDLIAFSAPSEEDSAAFEALMMGMRRPRQTDGLLRIGVQFADGAKATSTSGFHHGRDQPDGPVLQPGGSGGGGGRWHMDMWVWPLPPPGQLAFVCEWPDANVPVTRHEIDAQLILDAADRATVIFSDDDLPLPPG